jgi:hypothetical protein
MHRAVPFRFSLSLLILVAAGSCAPPQPAPRPAPVPLPTPPPRPTPTPTAAPAPAAEWRDWPLTPGTWAYRQDVRGSIALFGRPGEDADVTLRCDRQRGRIYLSRRSAAAAAVPLTIRTSSDLRRLSALPTGGEQPYVAVELGVRDPLLDAIGFSRGRFAIETGGMPALVLPPWPEILRVAEDCRG